MRNIDNYIESQYRELLSFSNVDIEYAALYEGIGNECLRDILMTLHHDLLDSFKTMNERLPTHSEGAHFWAESSRNLINLIEISFGLHRALKNSKYAFKIDSYYFDLMTKCQDFLESSGGSTLPPHMNKVELYYVIPIFSSCNVIKVVTPLAMTAFELKLIGSGSYANVYCYKDTFYNKNFVVKRAKSDLTEKELARFQREFAELAEFSSPYIIEVYRYDSSANEYIMEHMNFTLDEYIQKNNALISMGTRKNIVNQIFRAFKYMHSKERLHRDISPNNILLKEYHDILVAKISDFGLVKVPESSLTTVNTEFKGYFNDPSLMTEGFDNYNILHETYALTRIVYYVMTGKTNTDNIENPSLRAFVRKGLSANKIERFQSVQEMMKEFHTLR
jgi:serine/threonine-protein kinase